MTRPRFWRGAAALAAVFLGSFGCASHRAATTEPAALSGVQYENRTANIRFSYPASWHPVKGDATVTLVPVEESSVRDHWLTVDDPDLPPHIPGFIPLGAVEAGFVNDLRKRYKDLHETSSAACELDGASARRIVANGTGKTGAVSVNAIVCVRGDSVYVIDAESDATGEKIVRQAFDQVFASFRWIN